MVPTRAVGLFRPYAALGGCLRCRNDILLPEAGAYFLHQPVPRTSAGVAWKNDHGYNQIFLRLYAGAVCFWMWCVPLLLERDFLNPQSIGNHVVRSEMTADKGLPRDYSRETISISEDSNKTFIDHTPILHTRELINYLF